MEPPRIVEVKLHLSAPHLFFAASSTAVHGQCNLPKLMNLLSLLHWYASVQHWDSTEASAVSCTFLSCSTLPCSILSAGELVLKCERSPPAYACRTTHSRYYSSSRTLNFCCRARALPRRAHQIQKRRNWIPMLRASTIKGYIWATVAGYESVARREPQPFKR